MSRKTCKIRNKPESSNFNWDQLFCFPPTKSFRAIFHLMKQEKKNSQALAVPSICNFKRNEVTGSKMKTILLLNRGSRGRALAGKPSREAHAVLSFGRTGPLAFLPWTLPRQSFKPQIKQYLIQHSQDDSSDLPLCFCAYAHSQFFKKRCAINLSLSPLQTISSSWEGTMFYPSQKPRAQ